MLHENPKSLEIKRRSTIPVWRQAAEGGGSPSKAAAAEDAAGEGCHLPSPSSVLRDRDGIS